jgi:LmbE family N-acetylglucosaminyl deacetylase
MANMTFFGQSLLFLGAHPDDIELGCGALIADVSDQTSIYCMTFSDNRKNPELQNLVSEHYESMRALGLKDEQVELGTF